MLLVVARTTSSVLLHSSSVHYYSSARISILGASAHLTTGENLPRRASIPSMPRPQASVGAVLSLVQGVSSPYDELLLLLRVTLIY